MPRTTGAGNPLNAYGCRGASETHLCLGVYQEVVMDVELLTGLGVAAFILAISVLVGQEVGLPTNVLETQATVTSNH